MYGVTKDLQYMASEATNAVNATRYPSLKHFWQCKEADGATKLVDVIGGLTIPGAVSNPPASPPSTMPGAIEIDLTTAVAISGGSINLAGADETLIIMAVADFGLNGFITLGEPTDTDKASFEMKKLTNGKFRDTEATQNTWTPATGFVNTITAHMRAFIDVGGTHEDGVTAHQLRLLEMDSAWSISGATWTEDAAYSAAAPGTYRSSTGAYDDITPQIEHDGSNHLAGLGIFVFETCPEDVIAALHWMAYQWAQGNKVIWPGWLYKS